ncbi:MAG TPA: sigma-70 family RNA polymerase sigma factor [Cytophagaceae bacterium]|jgi:RNA polymerase sigma-70 factor (ECF subfamily)|nr:sigma-70 family RNA polymerase sigma factor [Cytophagaceae bacterium]
MVSEKELVEGCQKQQNYAQKMLYKKYAPEMKAVCLMYIKDKDIVKDVIQDSFIKVFENLHSYRFDGPLGAWIRKIVINTTLNHLRKIKKTETQIVKEDYEQIEIVDETDDEDLNEMIYDLTGEDLHYAISQLPEKFRIVFSLFYLEDYSHKEIAKKLDIGETLSRVSLNRSKKILRGILLDILTIKNGDEKGVAKK